MIMQDDSMSIQHNIVPLLKDTAPLQCEWHNGTLDSAHKNYDVLSALFEMHFGPVTNDTQSAQGDQ